MLYDPSSSRPCSPAWSFVLFMPHKAVRFTNSSPKPRLLKVAEAVLRATSSPGCNTSGSLIHPCDTCKAHLAEGLKERRPLQLSKRGLSKLYRASSGSRPVNEEASIFQLP